MDQCDDCSEVVCASCSTLLSCKFCGGGLCEDCATACGRCGIVLCSRDAKFAVECDTCKLSYCLVCLASGTKDPCVRCGHRPSKRVEQLVHLRLKSIYKAFKQSGAQARHDRDKRDEDSSENVGAVLQAAAAAAATHRGSSSSTKSKKPTPTPMEKFKVKQAEADAAAAELLAELEQEEEIAAASKSKKSKKKKKKERQQAKKEEEKKKAENVTFEKKEETETESEDQKEDEDQKEEEEEEILLPETSKTTTTSDPEVDLVEKQLVELVENQDEEGMEALLATLKGVPGRAQLRKNAKKALKRLREANAAAEEPPVPDKPVPETDLDDEIMVPADPSVSQGSDAGAPGYKPPEPLLKLVSHTHRAVGNTPAGPSSRLIRSNSTQSASNQAKAECVMHMNPSVVGWVIGKGGQRIRDLMEESGAKVWIDQDSMTSQDPRVVYVSGSRKSVDAAVRMIKDLVAKAPVGGAAGTPVSTSVPPAATAGVGRPPLIPADAELTNPEISAVPPALPKPTPRVARSASASDEPRSAVPLRRAESEGGGVHHHHHHHHERRGPDWATEELTCEARFVPLLIGRRGWTIKHIQDSSGARVDIDQTVSPRKVKISGKASCVRTAKRMVSDVLSYPHAQLHYHGAGNATDAVPPTPTEEAPPDDVAPPLPAAIPDVGEPPRGQPTMDGEGILKAALKATAMGNKEDSSPPVSLNIRSTISASSSLSSTPEPSMASTSQQQLSGVPVGPLLTPDVFVAPGALPQGYQQQLNTTGNLPSSAPVNDTPLFSGAVSGLSNRPAQHVIPPTQQMPSVVPPAPGFSNGQQQMLSGQPMMQDSMTSNRAMASGNVHAPPASAAPHLRGIGIADQFGAPDQQNKQLPPLQQANQTYQPSHFMHRSSSAPETGYRSEMDLPRGGGGGIFGNGANPDALAGSLWGNESGRGAAGLDIAGQRHQKPMEGYQSSSAFSSTRPIAGGRMEPGPLGYGSQERHSVHQEGAVNQMFPPGLSNRNADFLENTTSSGGLFDQNHNESNLVDNLFGPSSSGAGAEQTLLGRFQSLDINSGAMENWNSSSLPGWRAEGQGGDGTRATGAGATGFHQSSVPTDRPLHGQQPSQSRLNW